MERSSVTNQFSLLNNTLPFNKHAFLTTHNSYAIEGEPLHTPIPRQSVPLSWVGELTALLTSDLGSLKSIVSDNISRDRGFRALSEASNSTLCKRIEPLVFAALVPNSAEKSLKEVMEEIMGDHEMMDFAFVDDDVDGGWTVTSVHSIKTIV
ncbi:hypothetical protein POM88_025167 [Heracleum sosnowskyi]|uniref:Uncharacterized protein n=1 Tax=Heracleum sosnowskyi TaxID=360622 RepID=A0AAD8MNL0_9APIA|nr:hypothetical protein POM88_025167 [Heracleum sosnowskyi]